MPRGAVDLARHRLEAHRDIEVGERRLSKIASGKRLSVLSVLV